MIVSCLNCGKKFEKENYQIKNSPNNYCSRSCAAIRTNKLMPKRKKTKKCEHCNEFILSNRKKCKKCIKNNPKKLENKTLKDCIYSKHHRSSAFSLIRSMARSVAKQNGWKSCNKCGYDKHIEIAHIKPISSFSDNTLISTINNITNLIPLCPNCHWEHDNLNTR